MTAGTIEDPNIQGHLLPVSTGATCLTRIGRIDFGERSASFFRFARELTKECRPRGICNAFGKTMVMHHAVHRQVFYRNDSEVVNDLPAFLMREIVTPELDTLMDSSHGFTLFASLGGPLQKRAQLTLDLSKGFLFLAKKARVGYLLSIGEGCKGFQADINPHLGRHIRQTKRFTFTGKRDVPLACSRTLHRTGFHLALERAMVDHRKRANLGEAHAVVMSDTKATFQHISIVGQTEQECKREAAPHLPQRGNAAFIPMDKSQGPLSGGSR